MPLPMRGGSRNVFYYKSTSSCPKGQLVSVDCITDYLMMTNAVLWLRDECSRGSFAYLLTANRKLRRPCLIVGVQSQLSPSQKLQGTEGR